jgi:Outer membrane protein
MKKLIVLLLMLLPMGAFSQEMKIAFVDFQEVFSVMPELAEAETKYASIRAQYDEQINALQTEFTAKYEEYMKIEATLTENLKLRRQQELQELNDRYQNFIPQAQQDLDQEQTKLMTPIQEKINNAIIAVAEEQGYDYTLNSQVLFHTGRNAVDATPLVKAKLGIR